MRLKLSLRTVALSSATGLTCGFLAATAVLAQERSVILTNTVRAVALKSEPVTITLTPRPEFASAFEAARQGHGTVALAVEGIEGKSTQPIRINVFFDKPDATRATALEDPHFLGYVYIIPRRGEVKGTGRAFDLSSVKIFDAAAPLRITLVPIAGADATPRDASLSVGQIYVRQEN